MSLTFAKMFSRYYGIFSDSLLLMVSSLIPLLVFVTFNPLYAEDDVLCSHFLTHFILQVPATSCPIVWVSLLVTCSHY